MKDGVDTHDVAARAMMIPAIDTAIPFKKSNQMLLRRSFVSFFRVRAAPQSVASCPLFRRSPL
jgi:hypothetical protein